MASTAATKPAPEDDRKHILDKHLEISVNREKKVVELRYALKCDDQSCTLPDSVGAYSCPTRPCPP